MSAWRVVVRHKAGAADHRGAAVKTECARAGLAGVKRVRAGHVYEVDGAAEADARRLAERLLADPVTQEAVVAAPGDVSVAAGSRMAQVWLKPGVADPVADTVRLAAKDLGVAGLAAVRSGSVFEFFGAVKPQDVRRFCEDYLMNPLVQQAEVR